MTLAEQLFFGYREALAAGLFISFIAAMIATPKTIHKLKGAKIVGRDINKPGRPEVAEMGGLAVFLAFNVGAFFALAFAGLHPSQQALILASLVVAAGALVTGVLDDLVVMRQRFKAFIPFAFAIPLALFVQDTSVTFPIVGRVEFGLVYVLLLVPAGVACASNGFNMLEGLNGLGTGLGIIIAAGMSIIAILEGRLVGLILLFPLIGALGGFLYYNHFPAKVFPGDTMTLVVGAVLGSAAIVSKIEFWGALMLLPHILEFVLKARGKFEAESFASSVSPDGRLHYDGGIQSLTHPILKTGRFNEGQAVGILWAFVATYVGLVVLASQTF